MSDLLSPETVAIDSGGPPPPPGTEDDRVPDSATPWWQRRWSQIGIVVVVFMVGVGVGGTEPGDLSGELATAEQRVEQADARIDELEAELVEARSATGDSAADAEARLEAERQELQEEFEARQEALDERRAALDAREAELDASESEPAAGAGGTGELSAGAFVASDVQVSEDFLGDFQARARVLNTGDSTSAFLTMTLFHEGSVVASLQAVASDWPAGETRTLEFIGNDEFGPYDDVELQVDVTL